MSPRPSPLPCWGLELGSRRYLLGLAHRKARAARQRERRPFAVTSRATSIVGKDFLPAIAPKNPLSDRAMGVLQIAR
jgi:hypothetical protein